MVVKDCKEVMAEKALLDSKLSIVLLKLCRRSSPSPEQPVGFYSGYHLLSSKLFLPSFLRGDESMTPYWYTVRNACALNSRHSRDGPMKTNYARCPANDGAQKGPEDSFLLLAAAG